MGKHIVKIKSIEKVTHDVLQIVTDKPSVYTFVSGQATDVSINNADWKDEKRHLHLPAFLTTIILNLLLKPTLHIKALPTSYCNSIRMMN